MDVYRIALARYSDTLIASGNPARWNPKDVYIIYAASSRSLACLENVVNRDKLGLIQPFNLLTINCPSVIKIKTIPLNQLPRNWTDYENIHLTRDIGEKWVKENKSAILRVPSAVIEQENNYLLNPNHEDFKHISIIKTESFTFDRRIKQ